VQASSLSCREAITIACTIKERACAHAEKEIYIDLGDPEKNELKIL